MHCWNTCSSDSTEAGHNEHAGLVVALHFRRCWLVDNLACKVLYKKVWVRGGNANFHKKEPYQAEVCGFSTANADATVNLMYHDHQRRHVSAQ